MEWDTYLPRQHAKKYEDEHPLERVEDCKKICGNHRSLYDVEDPEDPGSPKEEQESKSTAGTGSRQESNIGNSAQERVIFPPSLLWTVNAA